MTGWGERLDLVELERRGIRFVLAKPFAASELLARVAAVLTARQAALRLLSSAASLAEEDRTVIRSFVVGAVTGGAIVWLWGGEIRRALDGVTADLRGRAADGLEKAAARLEAAASTVERGEPRAAERRGA